MLFYSMPATPQTPDELDALVEALLTDPLFRQNTAAKLRQILKAQNASMVNRLLDGATGGNPPDYAALLAALRGKQDKVQPRTANYYKPGLPATDLLNLEVILDYFFNQPSGTLAYMHTFRYCTEAEAQGDFGGETLNRLDYSTLYTFSRVLVEKYREDPSDLTSPTHFQELIAVYDPNAPASRQGWRTSGGAAANAGRIGLQLVKLDDPAATGVLKHDVNLGVSRNQLRYDIDEQGAFFIQALQDMAAPVPQPVRGQTTAYWKPTDPPPVPGGGPMLSTFDLRDVPTSVRDAVRDPSNTWVYGDLTAYGNATLQNAGAPPAQAGQHASILVGTAVLRSGQGFDAFEKGSTTIAWRYRYERRNDGTSGWTRTGKTA